LRPGQLAFREAPIGRGEAYAYPRSMASSEVATVGSGSAVRLRGLTRRFGDKVAAADVWQDAAAAKARIGVVQDTPALFDRLTGNELLAFHGALRRLDPATVRERSEELLRVLDLAVDADRLVVDYSLGMTKKLALAAALLHAPRVLFLDEPFGAIDPVSTNVIEQLLHRFVAGGGTIVFSSHVMDVVERLCDRVAVILRGRIVAAGTRDEVAPGGDLRAAFFKLVGAREDVGLEELEWLGSSSG